MSINWVMLDDSAAQSFVNLPGERTLYSSPSRTSFSLSSSNTQPGAKTIALSSGSGIVHLTNHRIVYIPTQRTKDFESFSCPINHLHDTHVAVPFFGANCWTAVVQPVADGGLTSVSSAIELKLVFKEGGAFDFYTMFERVKERFLQVLETARASGREGRPMEAVHLDELPAYEAPPPAMDEAGSPPLVDDTASYGGPPAGPPPGYEEAQRESVATELQRQYNSNKGGR